MIRLIIFRLQKTNKCVTSKDGKATEYAKYGKSSKCIEDEKGNGLGMGSKANFVYLG